MREAPLCDQHRHDPHDLVRRDRQSLRQAEVPLGEWIAVFTPITWPSRSSSGPPLFPRIDRGVGLDQLRGW